MNDTFYNRFSYINYTFDGGSKFVNGGSILIIHRYKLYIHNIRAHNADYMRLVKFNDVLIYLTNHYARKM